MKHLNFMLRTITVLAILTVFALPTFAAEELNVYPTETTAETAVSLQSISLYSSEPVALAETDPVSSDPVPTHTISDEALSFIIGFEGFSAEPYWDVNRYSIGHGNSYESAKKLFGEDCAPITEEQAFQLLKSEIVATERYMNSFFVKNQIVLNQNQYDALLSFTYNVGIGWTTYQNKDGDWCLLRTMLEDDPATWTQERADKAFGSWVSAGGQILDGLVQRRAAEAKLFMTPVSDAPAGEDSGNDTDDGSGEGEGDDPAPLPSFSDVAEDKWYHAHVMLACQLGLIRGMGDGTFQPEAELTRAQLVQLLANYEGLTDLDSDVETGFTDVPAGRWYSGPIAWAVENGYVNGMGNGTFLPDEPVTREQMCTILARYLMSKGITAPDSALSFSDADSILGYARESVAFCTTLGLVQGMPDGSFSPQTGATRAQAATVLLRMVDLG